MRRDLGYQIDLDIERVYLAISMKCDVQIWWRSGKGKIATKNSIKLVGTQTQFEVREKLSIMARIVMENGVLREKKTELLILLFTGDNQSKLGGKIYLNLAQFISTDSLTSSVSKRLERSLESCPDQKSRIVFTISCKFVQQNFLAGSDNLHDISFQANNFGGGSSFGKSTSDMTFRPERQKQQLNYRRQNTMPIGQNAQESGREYSPKQRKTIGSRDQQKQKIIDTPSWDRTARQKQQYQSISNNPSKLRERQFQKLPPPSSSTSTSTSTQQRPLQFSFNPQTQADKNKIGIDNTEIVRDLKQIVEQRGRTIKSLQDELSRVKKELDERQGKSSSKSIALLNQINTTAMQKQQLQRQKNDLVSQLEQSRDEAKKIQQKCKSLQFQLSESNNQFVGKLQQRKKMVEELNNKLEDADRRANKYQDELFKKENEIITKEKQYNSLQNTKDAINKQQTDKLKSISLALKDLQVNFERVFAQKEEVRKKYQQTLFKLQRAQQNTQKSAQNIPKLEQELARERERSKLIQSKYKQRELIIQQIQSQFKAFSLEKTQQLKQKDEQLSVLRDKFNTACKKIDEVAGGQESMKNTISQKNIRIKSMENICGQLQKTIEEKQDLIAKAKQYITAKQQQLQQKNNEIAKRDQFIEKCRNYMETKEKQYNDAMNGIKNNNNSETVILRKQLKQKEHMLEQYINNRRENEKQMSNMFEAIERLKRRVMECEDFIQELERKNESQESTLKDLVKKNLDMEIQINIKDYEIQTLRDSK